MTESEQRVADTFPHEWHCHTNGCPGVGMCYDVEVGVAPITPNTRCASTTCSCILAAIQKVVREERALVLENAGDAIFNHSTKPQRGLRKLRAFAGMVRAGEA